MLCPSSGIAGSRTRNTVAVFVPQQQQLKNALGIAFIGFLQIFNGFQVVALLLSCHFITLPSPPSRSLSLCVPQKGWPKVPRNVTHVARARARARVCHVSIDSESSCCRCHKTQLANLAKSISKSSSAHGIVSRYQINYNPYVLCIETVLL